MVSRIKEKAVRSEKEMYELIINTAKDDDRIRAAYISGSRANPNAPRDIFMDYDVVYVVDCTAPFIEDKLWIDRFGERLFMQYPDENCDYGDSDKETCYGWLMQLADGNRIDLHVCTQKGIQQDLEEQMYIVLLDKDGILPPCEPGDRYYYVKKPSQKRFGEVCNEFWWCLDNVAKGLWRGEQSYALEMIDFHVRPQLLTVISWLAGVNTDFSASVGKSGKYAKNFVGDEVWERYLSTYCAADTENIWRAVFSMCDLFDEIAKTVERALGLEYNNSEAEGCMLWLNRVKATPRTQK